jgi:hypothetical protein
MCDVLCFGRGRDKVVNEEGRNNQQQRNWRLIYIEQATDSRLESLSCSMPFQMPSFRISAGGCRLFQNT